MLGIAVPLIAGFAALGLGLSFASVEGDRPSSAGPTHGSAWTVDPDALSGLGGLRLGRLERIHRRIGDAAQSCLRAGRVNRRTARKAELSRLFDILSRSPLARDLMERAGRRGVYVCADPETDLLAYYLSSVRLIGLNPRLNEGQRIAFLAHELSHMPQHHVFSDNRFFPAHDLILLRRMREAAAEAAATVIAWQLRADGYTAAWEAKSTDRFYGDIARAFAAVLRAEPVGHLRAARAAFDQWFAEQARLDVYDRMTVDHLRRISVDRLGLVTPRKELAHGFLLGLGRLGGRNYLAATPGRRLTDPFYAGRISLRNAGLIERVLETRDGLRNAARPGPPRFSARTPVRRDDTWAVSRP